MCPLRCDSAIIEIFEMFHASADFFPYLGCPLLT